MAPTAFCTLWLEMWPSKCIIVWETGLGWHWLLTLDFEMNSWEQVIYFSLSVIGVKLNNVFFPCLKFWSQILLAAWSSPISSFLVFPLHIFHSLFSWEPVLGSSFVSWYIQLMKLLENAGFKQLSARAEALKWPLWHHKGNWTFPTTVELMGCRL